MGIKPFGSWVSKPLVHGYQNLWIIGYQITFSQKKEDIKMDEQIKIKILKSFDHGLQKHFYKNKEGH
jgi:hypothetical protein